jgi:hypothetical protein
MCTAINQAGRHSNLHNLNLQPHTMLQHLLNIDTCSLDGA